MTELEARLIAHPDDVDAYLVHADWLQAKGDPRGELVVVQVQLASSPGDPALLARQRELLRKHRVAWLGELADLSPRDLEPTWRYGFVRGVRIGPQFDVSDATDIDVAATIGQIRRMPAAEHVRELAIGAIAPTGYPTSWAAVVSGIAEHGVPPNLELLSLSCGRHRDPEGTALGDLSAAYPRLANLRELVLYIGGIELGIVALPELRVFDVAFPTKANLAALRTASWPRIERLALSFRDSPSDEVGVADLAWLLAGENVAGVRRLELVSTSFTDQLALGLCRSRVLAQLEVLDLSFGAMGDDGARAILANAKRFAHLRRLDLSHSYLTDEVRAALAALGDFVILDDPQSPDDDYRVPASR